MKKKNKTRQTFKFKLSPLLVVMAAVMIFAGQAVEIATYLAVVILHELAHAELSKRLGYALTEFRLMPYGAGLTGEFEGVKRSHEIEIALIGPFVNLFLGVLTIAVWWLAPSAYSFTEQFMFANIFTAVINLVPIFPLDGGRALLAYLSGFMPRQKAYRIMRIFSAVAGIALAAVSMLFYRLFNISFLLMAAFVLASTIIPDKNSKYQRLYSLAFRLKKIKEGLPVREIMVDGSTTLMSMLRMLNGNYYTRFTVAGSDLTEIGKVTETELERYASRFPQETSISAAAGNLKASPPGR